MYINKEQIQIGVTNYVENEIGKKAVGFNKFATYFAMPIINKKVVNYIDSFAKNPLTKDLFDENENLNIDEVYNMAKNAVQKSGQFLYMGILFNESDIDKLYTYVRG